MLAWKRIDKKGKGGNRWGLFKSSSGTEVKKGYTQNVRCKGQAGCNVGPTSGHSWNIAAAATTQWQSFGKWS